MKYVSLIFFILCLAFTWNLSTSEDPVGVRVHHAIQSDLAKIIQAAVVQQLPGMTNFRFTKLYTKSVDASNVKAMFAYSFVDPSENQPTERSIEGEALVHRDSSNNSQWVLSQIKVDQSTIEFQEGAIITAGEDSASDTDEAATEAVVPSPTPSAH